MSTLRRATIYFESREVHTTNPQIKILTSGLDKREGQTNVSDKYIDVFAENLYIEDVPDFGDNEIFLEVESNSETPIDNLNTVKQFKRKIEVPDHTPAADIQGQLLISKAKVMGPRISLGFRLTEIDQVNEEKMGAVMEFVNSNDIADITTRLLGTAGFASDISAQQIIKTITSATKLIDKLNDDDRIWVENPKMRADATSNFPLYEGYYAYVTTPEKRREKKLPHRLYKVGTKLYTKWTDEDNNEEFDAQTYFTFEIRLSPNQ